MRASNVQYKVRMDQKTFRAFAAYDTFRLKKHARLPVIFLLIMAAFAAVAIASGKPQSWLIAGVLLLVGLGMPAMYAFTFFSQVKKQGQALKLDAPRLVYTVTLAEGHILIHNELRKEEDVRLKWDQLYRVIIRRDCVYLYAVPQKAFVLPDRDADCGAYAARAFIRSHMPGNKK